MIDVETLFNQVLLLVLMLIPGVILSKCRFADEKFAKGLANLVLYIAQPAMIISPFIRDFDKSLLSGILGVLVFSFTAHLMFFGIAMLLFKRTETAARNVLRFAIVFSNAGYMGIPLIEALLGSEAAVYATVYNISFQFFIWSFGCFIYSGDKSYISPKKMLLNPASISIYIGLLLFLLPINSFVPVVAVSALDMLKGLVAPLSMILVGYHMASADYSGVFKNMKMWVSIVMRLLVCPAIIFSVMKLSQVLGIYDNFTAIKVVLITSATPAATATSMFAEKFDGDTKLSGVIVPVCTVCSVVTMPAVSLLLNLL